MNNIFFIINCFFFTLQATISVLFIDQYLTRKYGKKSFIYGALIMLILVYLIMKFFYTNIPLRMILGVAFFEIISWLFYDGKTLKKFLTGPIIFVCYAFSEFFTQIILVFILDIPIFTNLTPVPLAILMFFNTLIILMIMFLFLHFFSPPLLSTPQYSKLVFSSITTTFLVTIILSESLFMNQLFLVDSIATSYSLSIIVSSICLILSILLNIYIFYSIKSLKKDICKEVISQSLRNEYLLEINNYLSTKNNCDNTSHLRHDIMNYIQTVSIYKQQEVLQNDTKN